MLFRSRGKNFALEMLPGKDATIEGGYGWVVKAAADEDGEVAVGAAFGHLPSVVTVHDLSFLVEPKWFRRDRALYLRLMAARSARRALRVIAEGTLPPRLRGGCRGSGALPIPACPCRRRGGSRRRGTGCRCR